MSHNFKTIDFTVICTTNIFVPAISDNTFVSAIIHNTFATIPLSTIPYTGVPTVEGDSGHVVLYGGVGGWWHGGRGGSWAPHGDIMVFVGELVVELEGCIDDRGSSSALEVLQRVIFKAFAARA